MGETKNILLCGVGGQGTILVSKVLSAALVEAGYDVKMSEIHGMSQRGGSVTTQVRYGKKVYSPIIDEGAADILVSFEVMEAMRNLKALKPGGQVVVNDCEIPTATTLSGSQEYPADILTRLSSIAPVRVIQAEAAAKELGNPKVQNIVLLGALVRLMGLGALDWERAVAECVKPQFVEINVMALKKGEELADEFSDI